MPWNYYIMDWVVVLRCETFVLEEWDKVAKHLSWGCETFLFME